MSEQQMSEYVIYGTAESIALDEVGIQYFIVNLEFSYYVWDQRNRYTISVLCVWYQILFNTLQRR